MRLPRLAVLVLAVLATGCVVLFRGVKVESVTPGAGTTITTRSRAHLLDGSTVLFPLGFQVEGATVKGSGTRYRLRLDQGTPVSGIPLDSIAGIESYTGTSNPGASIGVSLLASAGVTVAGSLLAVAIFGSCPTIYADSAGALALEAEGFSYSIAAAFESRDVDRLRVQPGRDGIVRLEVRNEALETHFLNQLGLLEVRHHAGEIVAPDPSGRPLALRDLHPLQGIQDAGGDDQTATLAAADERATHSPATLLAAASESRLSERLEFDLAVPAGADSVALYLRARNSLLTTVLFYDVMLARQGAGAVAWVGAELGEVGPLAALGRWASSELGLHVQVREATGWREVVRVADPGPIAWKDIAILLPANGPPVRRVRLEYLIDNWRIDRLASAAWRRPEVSALTPRRVTGPDRAEDRQALGAIQAADPQYLETQPGDRFELEFVVGPLGPGESRTLLLVAQGYYTEWIRPAWIAHAKAPLKFEPGRPALLDAVRRWAREQGSLEQRFYSTRIPVR
ncbi:MAG TPA: hypothetical protein VGP61_09005 [Gemmatimonadales bacterium]|nr:hypothetical protein [Gemmatimonadales bacterium]